MAASHFFVGMGAGIAILSIPVLTLGGDLPHRVIAWIEAPASQVLFARTDNVGATRPERGYRPGDPTPGPEAPPPTVAMGNVKPTATPAPPVAQQAIAAPVQAPAGSMRTGIIRGNGAPVYVRRAAGVERTDDPVLADGSPVLVSAGPALQVGAEAWRAVRALNGIVGWVQSAQVALDGEAPPAPMNVGNGQAAASASSNGVADGRAARAAPAPTPSGERARITNTGGVGVVLRNSPNDADRSRTGLMEGAVLTVLERSGVDWVRVRADNGQEGWVPARYLAAAG